MAFILASKLIFGYSCLICCVFLVTVFALSKGWQRLRILFLDSFKMAIYYL